jgi:hypothetical protein
MTSGQAPQDDSTQDLGSAPYQRQLLTELNLLGPQVNPYAAASLNDKALRAPYSAPLKADTKAQRLCQG